MAVVVAAAAVVVVVVIKRSMQLQDHFLAAEKGGRKRVKYYPRITKTLNLGGSSPNTQTTVQFRREGRIVRSGRALGLLGSLPQQPGGERHLRQSNTADPKPEESGGGGFVQPKFRFLAKESDAIQISMPH